MSVKFREGSLTKEEKAVVKNLLGKGWRGQDILALINIGRRRTTNSGRITGVKKDSKQSICTEEALHRFIAVKNSHDLSTGLNPYFDERLCKAREAMLMAVQLFNSPLIGFKSEIFSVLSNIAWTYLCHEKLTREKQRIIAHDGRHIQLSAMLDSPHLALSNAVRANLLDVKDIRDKAEHSLLGKSDDLWRGLFQANCLNFDKIMCDWFGPKLSLRSDVSFSLQFARANIEQLSQLANWEIPPEMSAFNAELKARHAPEVISSADYEFAVIYTMIPSSKAKSHFQFVSPDSAEGLEISNILVKQKAGDEMYPYKPKDVISLVSKEVGRKFSMTNHTEAWKKHKIRPETDMPDSKKTNSAFCMYHRAHRDYTYNDAWVKKLIEEYGSLSH